MPGIFPSKDIRRWRKQPFVQSLPVSNSSAPPEYRPPRRLKLMVFVKRAEPSAYPCTRSTSTALALSIARSFRAACDSQSALGGRGAIPSRAIFDEWLRYPRDERSNRNRRRRTARGRRSSASGRAGGVEDKNVDEYGVDFTPRGFCGRGGKSQLDSRQMACSTLTIGAINATKRRSRSTQASSAPIHAP